MRRRTADRQDRRTIAAYSPNQAAAYFRLPMATVRAWSVGQGSFRPVLATQRLDHRVALSFVNLVEVHVLHALRELGLTLQAIRRSIAYLKRHYQVEHPLADMDLLTDGFDLWLEELGHLVAVSQSGQMGIPEVLLAHLQRVERAVDGRAIRLYPFIRNSFDADQPRKILIDPEISFGQPVIEGSGIPTRIISQRFEAGDTIEHLAQDYDRGQYEIEEAIRWERRAA